ncbi:MAG: Omp28-related outer membrane protein [Flavobacteriales bacterium]|nr:Omp28-related outer membrane protein [Flavobacteriales bacterium]
MKKHLLSLALTTFSVYGFAQTFVSTNPENRNVVLEEFTGIYCPNCPDGHKKAQQFADNNPGDVVLVNVHTGSYAQPSGNDPNFQTSFGAALANQSGLCGYPAGTVNREYFPNYYQVNQSGNPCGTEPTAQSRGTWSTSGGLVLQESSPVNVAAQATLDLSTRKLTVVVEAYYTGDAVNTSNKLTVAVLQNNVEGPQDGSSANQTQVLPNGNYNHKHMLRHFLTGQWGASVSPTSTGSFFTDTYTWDVPAEINDIPLDLNNLEVVVYIAEGNENIITGSEAELIVVSPNTYDALPASIELPEYLCESEIEPKVTIQNMGNETLTNLTIRYNVNGGPIETYNWTGSLATASMEEVTLPSTSFTHMQENVFWVSTTSPNGQSDEVASNNDAVATFYPAKNSGSAVDIVIVTDNYGSETTWKLRNPNGQVVASGGPYTNGSSQTITENVTGLANGCHTFEIYDQYGDGMCCSYGQGSFTLKSNGVTLYTGGEFGSSDERLINVGGSLGINDDLELVNDLSVYPNPFSDNARISFSMAETAEVSLEVVNILGAKVMSQNMGEKAAGTHSSIISAAHLDAGIYMVNLLVEGRMYSTRVSITK